MSTTLLFALALSQNPPAGLDKPITLAEPGASAASVIERIAQETGAKLTTDPNVGREPILLSVRNRPAQEVIDSIARALGCAWTDRSGTLHLVTDKARIDELAKKRDQLFRASLAAGVETTLKEMEPKDWGGDSGKQAVKEELDKLLKIADDMRSRNANLDPGTPVTIFAGGSMDKSPAHDLLRAIIAKMDLAKLASIPAGESVTYATNPNRMQKAFGFAINRETSAFIKSHNELAQIINEAKRNIPSNVRLRSALLNVTSLPGQIDKTLVTVRRDKMGHNYSLDLVVASQEGVILNRAGAWVNAAPDPIESVLPEFDLKGQDGQVISIPEVHRELAINLNNRSSGNGNRFMSTMSFGGGAPAKFISIGAEDTTPFSEEARALASRPDRYEPLGLAPADLLLEFAKMQNLDVVAVLPDSAVMEAGKALNSGQVALGRIPELLKSSGCSAVLTNGLLEIQPSDHIDAWAKRANRKEVAQLTAQLYDHGYLSLSQAMKFCVEGWNIGQLDRAYLLAFTDEWEDPLYGYSHTPEYLRLLALMFPDGNIAPTSLTLGVLPQRSRTLVEKLLIETSTPNVVGRGSFIAVSMGDGGNQDEEPVPKLIDEPTEKFANGFPMNAALSVGVDSAMAALMRHEPSGRASFVTPAELSMRLSSGDLGETHNTLDYKSDALSYTPATLQHVRIGIQLSEQDRQDEWFKNGSIQAGAGRRKFADLPQDFAAEMARMRDSMRIGGGAAGNRPPPSP